MKVVFRADASPDIGHGHVMRCLALADALRVRGAQCMFVCRRGGDAAAAAVSAAGFALHVIDVGDGDPCADAAATSAALASGSVTDWLVVDHYRLGAAWESALSGQVGAVMAIDDLADRPHACRLLLDQNWHDYPAARYAGLLPPGCDTLFGPAWALLRAEFADARAARPARRDPRHRVLVCFGGGDAPNATGQVLQALKPLASRFELDVVVGAGNPHQQALRDLCGCLPSASLTIGAGDVASRMAAADLFIGAGGTMTWERACLGLPGITMAIADNQLALSRRLAAVGEGIDLGSLSPDALARLPAAVETMLADAEGLQTMGEALARRCDGLGAARVAERLYGLRAS